MGTKYHVEDAFSVLIDLTAKFKEIDVESHNWLHGENMQRHLYVMGRYSDVLGGFILMHQNPKSFAGFK